MKKSLKRIFKISPSTLMCVCIVLVLVLFYVEIPILQLIELKTYDLRFKSRGVKVPSPSVVMAVIDEKSLDSEGRWPWPRSKIAKLVESLSDDGAKVVAFDIGFLEPDENSNLQFIRQLNEKIKSVGIKNKDLLTFINDQKKTADNDAALAAAIKDSKANVVLGYFFHMSEEGLNFKIEQKLPAIFM